MSNIDQALDFYKGCAFGKQHKASYITTNKKESSLTPRVFFHSDICGPMQEILVGSACYYLLFKDDFT